MYVSTTSLSSLSLPLRLSLQVLADVFNADVYRLRTSLGGAHCAKHGTHSFTFSNSLTHSHPQLPFIHSMVVQLSQLVSIVML